MREGYIGVKLNPQRSRWLDIIGQMISIDPEDRGGALDIIDYALQSTVAQINARHNDPIRSYGTKRYDDVIVTNLKTVEEE